jgi:hypothetical protein
VTESGPPAPRGEFLLYRSDDGRTLLQVRFDGETVWLTQAQIADLFQTTTQNITIHVREIFADGEQDQEATCKDYLQVRQEGGRQVQRLLKHYSLPVILAIGYRVRSSRGTQFRQWATTRLTEFLHKGFTLDDERLKNPPAPGSPDYFSELLARIRDIRSSEKVFYKKVLEIYATSIDYDPRAEASQAFFKVVQNKMHWAAHGQTAAEVIARRADSAKPNMGLTAWTGGSVRKADVGVAKNYLQADEIEALNRIVTAYLEFAELQAMNRKPMHMADWIAKLDDFLKLSGRELLLHAGTVSHDDAIEQASLEYERFAAQQRALPSPAEQDFNDAVADVKEIEQERKKRRPKQKRDRPAPPAQ